ncbi:hypothetical protein PI125_g21005 [Phytophthora idaei]|nr:hypothetical protein PI125_g21005 [Phytophthora idaei]KAG3127415.1 hypothetical protein PI126_g21860 [Phytophthora idaei]
MPSEPRHTLAARTRVLDAFKQGQDWFLVAHHNAIPATTARRIVDSGSSEVKARGGTRASNVKCTLEMEVALVDYVEENCLYTLVQLQQMITFDFVVSLSTSLTSQKLCGKLYTMKKVTFPKLLSLLLLLTASVWHGYMQVRIEPVTCNSEKKNIEKRRVFAEALLKYEREGAFIVYYDETNFNLYCKRLQGRALQGERAVIKLPSSKGKNLQVQCAVSTEIGLVHCATQRGTIKMEANVAFVDIYDAVKGHETHHSDFSGMPIVIVLDNAPAQRLGAAGPRSLLADVQPD